MYPELSPSQAQTVRANDSSVSHLRLSLGRGQRVQRQHAATCESIDLKRWQKIKVRTDCTSFASQGCFFFEGAFSKQSSLMMCLFCGAVHMKERGDFQHVFRCRHEGTAGPADSLPDQGYLLSEGEKHPESAKKKKTEEDTLLA